MKESNKLTFLYFLHHYSYCDALSLRISKYLLGMLGEKKGPLGNSKMVEEYYQNGELFNCKKFNVPKPIQTIN
jgi:hypothetical protein